MSTSPADKSPEPVRNAPIRSSLVRSRLNVRVRLTATRPVPRKRRIDPRWILVAMMFIGLVQGSYFFWAGTSALAAAPIFRGDASCNTRSLDSSRTISGGACRLEVAVVVSAIYSSGRTVRTYVLNSVSADGTRNHTPLAGSEGLALWGRAQPAERVLLQRFVAPGYYLTGKITAVADSLGSGMTRDHPDSRTHYEATYAVLGMLLFACAFALLVL